MLSDLTLQLRQKQENMVSLLASTNGSMSMAAYICFSECRVLCWLVVPYGFYLTLPQLIVFRSFFGLWLCACLRAMYRKCSSHIVSSIWLFIIFLLPLNKRGFVLLSGCLGLFLFHSLFCLLVFVRFIEILLPKVFCMTKIHINKTNSQLRKCNWGFLLLFFWRRSFKIMRFFAWFLAKKSKFCLLNY